ncbi:MAG: hypothetical protein VKL97_02290, partial [Cyanobacteriota bacterium]|nr:hypothetical protein [Cyanobacteriota bacterium]
MAFPSHDVVAAAADHGEQTALLVQQVGDGLGQRLRELHAHLLEQVADVDRIACVLYEPRDDMLKTFVNSTRHGEGIRGYEFPLHESAS